MNWTTKAARKEKSLARIERYVGPNHSKCRQRRGDVSRRINRIEKEFGCGMAELLLGFAAIDYSLYTTAEILRCPLMAMKDVMYDRSIVVDWPSEEEEIAAEEVRLNPPDRRQPVKSEKQIARRLAYEKERDHEHEAPT